MARRQTSRRCCRRRPCAFAPALLHALARQPADRTPTAGQMRDELLAAAKGPLLPLPASAAAGTNAEPDVAIA